MQCLLKIPRGRSLIGACPLWIIGRMHTGPRLETAHRHPSVVCMNQVETGACMGQPSSAYSASVGAPAFRPRRATPRALWSPVRQRAPHWNTQASTAGANNKCRRRRLGAGFNGRTGTEAAASQVPRGLYGRQCGVGCPMGIRRPAPWAPTTTQRRRGAGRASRSQGSGQAGRARYSPAVPGWR